VTARAKLKRWLIQIPATHADERQQHQRHADVHASLDQHDAAGHAQGADDDIAHSPGPTAP
jgi:hypothetical protein